MIASDFRLYDTLSCAAAAARRAAARRPAEAEAAWLDACLAASGLFTPGTPEDAAAGMILAATRPGAGAEDPERLCRALDAASLAALLGLDGNRRASWAVMPGACAAAAPLSRETGEALMTLLSAARRMAGTGVAS